MLLFVVVFALTQAGGEEAVAPLQEILNDIFGFIPNLIAAAVIGFVAWIVATLVKNPIVGVLGAAKVDERLGLGEKKPISNSLGIIAFFGIILLMLPTALVALQKANISSLTNDISQYAITAIVIAAAFALGVGSAITLGLGGRDRIKDLLDKLKG
ncbi:MAG: hypothetical protein P1U87_16915 [Verrucomicrobiales bacterium]|nr:hypothetical protein [Verrucomicrobiales bacterium]